MIAPEPADTHQPGRPSIILIVEDEVLIRMAISDYLQDCGFKTLEAGTAAEALDILASGLWSIELVFSDIQMPGDMDGLGLAAWVRANKPQVPIILCSGDARKASKAKELCGDERFFSKPYNFDGLVAHIRSKLGQVASS